LQLSKIKDRNKRFEKFEEFETIINKKAGINSEIKSSLKMENEEGRNSNDKLSFKTFSFDGIKKRFINFMKYFDNIKFNELNSSQIASIKAMADDLSDFLNELLKS
jgi:hypothetical protein